MYLAEIKIYFKHANIRLKIIDYHQFFSVMFAVFLLLPFQNRFNLKISKLKNKLSKNNYLM